MYLMYIDESGSPSLNDGTTYYVLLGVGILSEHLKKISDAIKEVVESVISVSSSAEKIEMCDPFSRAIRERKGGYRKKQFKLHYHDLIQGKEPYNNISETERRKIADIMFNIAVNNEITLFAVVINKRLHKKRYAFPRGPDLLGLEFLTGRFEKFLQRKSDYGIMILDEKERKQNMVIRNFFQELREHGTPYHKLGRVIECVFFSPAQYCYPLQLADFLAYAVFSKYEHKKDERFKQIEGKFDVVDGNMVGLKIWEPEEW